MKKRILLAVVCLIVSVEAALCGGVLIDQGNTVLNPHTEKEYSKSSFIDQGNTLLNPRTGEIHLFDRMPGPLIDQGDSLFNPRTGKILPKTGSIDNGMYLNPRTGMHHPVINNNNHRKVAPKELSQEFVGECVEGQVKKDLLAQSSFVDSGNAEADESPETSPTHSSSKTRDHDVAENDMSSEDIPPFRGDSLVINGKRFLKTPEGFVNINTGQYFEIQESFRENVAHIKKQLEKTVNVPDRNSQKVLKELQLQFPHLFGDN